MEQSIQELAKGLSIGIIMDGNGRWAKRRGLPRTAGHKKGAEVFQDITRYCNQLGVESVTFYAFSTENWRRPQDEVGALMQLFRYYARRLLKRAKNSNVRVKMIGEKSRFSPDLIEAIDLLERETKDNTGMTFIFAVNYGARDEITRAVRHMAEDCKAGTLKPEEITEACVSSYLDTAGIPDPDLLIRTSGELWLSNFLLWQLAYSEFYITDCLWPDFNREELLSAIRQYNKRERRFGGVSAAVK